MLEKIDLAKSCDGKIKEQIMEYFKFFELLGLSRDSLKNKIPVKVDPSNLRNCEEAKSLRDDLDTLDELKNANKEIIEKLFQMLNEENLVPQMILVLQKKKVEKSVFEENKVKFDLLFQELFSLEPKIENIKSSISIKNEAFNKVKNTTFKPVAENEEYFKNLDKYCEEYIVKLTNLNQGIKFYTEFISKLNEMNEKITDFLLARDIEKNEIFKAITGKNNKYFATNNQEDCILILLIYY